MKIAWLSEWAIGTNAFCNPRVEWIIRYDLPDADDSLVDVIIVHAGSSEEFAELENPILLTLTAIKENSEKLQVILNHFNSEYFSYKEDKKDRLFRNQKE